MNSKDAASPPNARGKHQAMSSKFIPPHMRSRMSVFFVLTLQSVNRGEYGDRCT